MPTTTRKTTLPEWQGSEVRSLRRAITSPAALVPIMQIDPKRAAEIMLAGMTCRPRASDWMGLRGSFGIVDGLELDDPLPESGPMIAFFLQAPDVAVETLIELVEYATANWARSDWADVDDHPTHGDFEILLNGERQTLVGNGNVMHWHRGDARVPRPLTSALMALEQHVYNRLDNSEDIDELLSRLMHSRSLAIFGMLVEFACYRPSLLTGPLSCLATSAGLILADRLYKLSDIGPLALGIRSEAQFNRMRAWHGMPHRKTTLDSQILPLTVDDGALAELMTSAREMWTRHPDDRWRYLVAQMDPANYKPMEVEGGARGWVFEMPEPLAAEIAAEQAALDAQAWWTTAPMQLSRWLQEEGEVSDDDAKSFWDDVQTRLAEIPPDDLVRDGVLRREDVECGAAAVLLLRAPTWTASHPDVIAFCREALLRPFQTPPDDHAFDYPGATVDWTWDGFAALAVPALWKRAANDEDLREVAVRLATHRHRNTVQRFLSTTDGIAALREDLHRLESLALGWARFRAFAQERRRREESAQYWDSAPRVTDLPDVETSTQALLGAFVDGSLPTALPDLSTFIDETPDGLVPPTAEGVGRIAHAVDVSYLLAAWSHLLALPDGIDGGERRRRLTAGRALAEVFAAARLPDEHGKVDGTPTEEERNLHERLGAMVVVAPADDARAIWEPILAAGSPAHYWVTDFIGDVWTAGLASDPTSPVFVDLLKEMMAFAFDHPAWKGFRRSEIELSLLCLHRYGHPRMEERHRPLLRALQPTWNERVRELVLRDSYAARPVAAFLAKPAAADVVEDGLRWFAERESTGARADSDLDETIAEVLVTIAGRDTNVFRRVSAAGEVLAALVARQNTIALQLSAQLGRTG
jgi:hypothetical protein